MLYTLVDHVLTTKRYIGNIYLDRLRTSSLCGGLASSARTDIWISTFSVHRGKPMSSGLVAVVIVRVKERGEKVKGWWTCEVLAEGSRGSRYNTLLNTLRHRKTLWRITEKFHRRLTLWFWMSTFESWIKCEARYEIQRNCPSQFRFRLSLVTLRFLGKWKFTTSFVYSFRISLSAGNDVANCIVGGDYLLSLKQYVKVCAYRASEFRWNDIQFLIVKSLCEIIIQTWIKNNTRNIYRLVYFSVNVISHY